MDKKVTAYHSGGWLNPSKNQKFFWFSSNPKVAGSYSKNFKQDDWGIPITNDYETYRLTIRNPFIVNAKGEFYLEIPTPEIMKNDWHDDTVDTDGIVEWAYKNGYGSVIIKNVAEGHGICTPATDYVLFDKNDFKFLRNNLNDKQTLENQLIDFVRKFGQQIDNPFCDYEFIEYYLKTPFELEITDKKISPNAKPEYVDHLICNQGELSIRDAKDKSIYREIKNNELKKILKHIQTEVKTHESLSIYETDSDSFKRWFGDSKIVDKDGKPLVVYHGTPKQFSQFDITHSSPYTLAGAGFYFTDSEKVAGSYLGGMLNRTSDDSHIKKCYLRMSKPYYWSEIIPDKEIKQLATFIKANEDEFFFKHILDSADDYDEKTFPQGWDFTEGGSFGPITKESLQAAINWLYEHGVFETNELIRENIWGLLTDDFHWISAKRALRQFIEKQGFDGVIYTAQGDLKPDSKMTDTNTCYVVFKPNQIKAVENKGNWSDSDNIYEDVEFNDNFNKWFGNSKVVDKNGNPLICYHGTPNGIFDSFKPLSHFSQNKRYADIYQNTGASSLSVKQTADNPMTYEVYLSIQNPFDTRFVKARKIFLQEYRAYYSPELTSKGLVDWMEVEELAEWLQENHPEYDGIIADEGGTGGYGDRVYDRGITFVPFNPNQIKAVSNKGSWNRQSNNIYENLNRILESLIDE